VKLPSIRFGDLGQLFDGPHATPTRQSQGPYFLNIASLVHGRLDLAQSDHVSAADFVRWTKRVTPAEGDLLFSYETRLGDAALMPGGVKACLGRRMALLRPNRQVVDPHFLLYYYLSPVFRTIIDRYTIHGATVNRIGLSTMGSWPISIPDLNEQRAIAEVLGALDDKIAANAKLASLLGEYIDASFVSIVGPWHERVPLGALVTITKGVSYRSADLVPSSTALVTLKSIQRDGSYSTRGLKAFAGTFKGVQKIRVGELVVAQTDLTQAADVVGRAVRVPASSGYDTLVASLDIAIVRPMRGVESQFVLGVMRDQRFIEHCKSRTSGTTVLHLGKDAVQSFMAPEVSFELQQRYAAEVGPAHDMRDAVERESELLATTRDALLPLLMSGKIRVKDAEQMVGDVV